MKIIIFKDFEGSMINNWKINRETVKLTIKKDRITRGYTKEFNYNHHFHFGISIDDTHKKKIKFLIECNSKEELKKSLKRIWISESIDREYELLEINESMKVPGKYRFSLELEPNKKYYIANFSPIRYTGLKKKINELSKNGDFRKVPIGRTVLGREIIAHEIGLTKEKPLIMMVSGYHPPEMEPIALQAIMEKFCYPEWKEEILEKFSFSFIPFLNPDGFANMKQGSNMNDINFHWRFFGNTRDECPEAYYIWEYCKKKQPIFFMDFHVFTFQNNEARPYLISPWYYRPQISKKIIKEINQGLTELCNGQSSRSEKILSPNILSSRLRIEMGTLVSPKFHLHIKDGRNRSKKLAYDSFLLILKVFEKHNLYSSNQILIKPYGRIKKGLFFSLFMRLTDFFNFRIRTKLNS